MRKILNIISKYYNIENISDIMIYDCLKNDRSFIQEIKKN